MFILIFSQLLKMFFIMLLAFICYRIKLVGQEGNRTVSNLLLLVVNPCVMITAFQTEYDPKLIHGLLLAFLAAAVSHILAVFAANLLVPAKNNPDYCIERYSVVYSNCGFIGIPLIQSVLGDKGVFFLAAYITVFNLFSWTHGLSLMKKEFSLKELREGMLSPVVLATGAALLLFFARIAIPEILLDPIEYIADMNTPLAMMVAGFSVAQADLKKLFSTFKIYRAAVLKLMAVPLLTLAALFLCKMPHDVAYTVLIAAACPTATTGTMMAIRYGQNYTYSSEIFAFSTLVSIFTIPVVIFFAGFVI
ncbi:MULTISPECIES: AEC family transporter [Mediterraneibacter]|uniref:AEC family transporter n=1 Tax=Mediterraneibacter TaxID=2316020 RepID=UPI0022E6059E|nr:AEC family transporter [Mediterraneibacter massiliensis]